MSTCEQCGGTGWVRPDASTIAPCDACGGPGGWTRTQVLPGDSTQRLVLRTQPDGTVAVHGLPPGVQVRKATVLPLAYGQPVVAILEVFGDLDLDLEVRPLMPMHTEHGALVVRLMRTPGGCATVPALAREVDMPEHLVQGFLMELATVGIVKRVLRWGHDGAELPTEWSLARA